MGLLGCHVSISGGIEKSPARSKKYGCEVMQVFTANQRRWNSKPISSSSIEQFKQNLQKNNIQEVVTHDNYLINLANPDDKKRNKSVEALINEVKRSQSLGIPKIILHPGSHLGNGEKSGIKLIANSLDRVCRATSKNSPRLLLETTAGQGNYLGYKFEHLRDIINQSNFPGRLSVCFDTCHAFAAGYDITNEDAYQQTFEEFDNILGLEILEAFHLNDSKTKCGSKKDRHCNLGAGYIGWDLFFRLVKDQRFREIPMLLETPDSDKYKEEIATLKNER